jgi:hypothetical protein
MVRRGFGGGWRDFMEAFSELSLEISNNALK